MPRPPAFETAAARGALDARAIPARRIGCWILRREQRGVWIDILCGGVEWLRGGRFFCGGVYGGVVGIDG